MDPVAQAVAQALARFPSGRWVVACSGGPDSTALARRARRRRRRAAARRRRRPRPARRPRPPRPPAWSPGPRARGLAARASCACTVDGKSMAAARRARYDALVADARARRRRRHRRRPHRHRPGRDAARPPRPRRRHARPRRHGAALRRIDRRPRGSCARCSSVPRADVEALRRRPRPRRRPRSDQRRPRTIAAAACATRSCRSCAASGPTSTRAGRDLRPPARRRRRPRRRRRRRRPPRLHRRRTARSTPPAWRRCPTRSSPASSAAPPAFRSAPSTSPRCARLCADGDGTRSLDLPAGVVAERRYGRLRFRPATEKIARPPSQRRWRSGAPGFTFWTRCVVEVSAGALRFTRRAASDPLMLRHVRAGRPRAPRQGAGPARQRQGAAPRARAPAGPGARRSE